MRATITLLSVINGIVEPFHHGNVVLTAVIPCSCQQLVSSPPTPWRKLLDLQVKVQSEDLLLEDESR